MAIELQIRKKPDNVWEHIKVSDGSVTIFSDFFVRWNGTTMEISEPNGNDNFRYNIIQVAVYDDTSGGNEETFTDSLVMASRLKVLEYPAFIQEGDVVISSLISSDGGNTIILGSDGKLYSSGGGGGSQDLLKEDAAVTGAYDIDWNFSTQLLTLTGDSTWSDINLPSVGITKVITLYVTGDFALTIPTDWTTNLTGAYDGTVLNQIVVEYVKSGIYWVTINQA